MATTNNLDELLIELSLLTFFGYLLWHLEHVSSSDLACMHQLVDLRQLLQVNHLEGCLDQATSEEVNGLCAVLSVSDV